MFDFDAGKLLIIGIVALIFIPSKDLPRVLRQLGQFVSKMRRMASEFQGQFMDAMREADMADLRREAEALSRAADVSVPLDPIHDVKTQLTAMIDGPPALSAAEAQTLGEGAHGLEASDPALSSAGSAAAELVEPAKPSSVTLEEGGIELSPQGEATRQTGSADLHPVTHGA